MKFPSLFTRILSPAFLFVALAAVLTGGGNAQAAGNASWKIVPSANGSQASNQLAGVAAISTSNAWAVGQSYGSSSQSLIEHWNGKTWKTVPTPDAGLSPDLKAVATVPGSNQIWAVGTEYTSANGAQPLIERWNGNVWKIIPSPLISGNTAIATNILYSVTATSVNDAWATGVYHKNDTQAQSELIEHWNGKQWSLVPAATILGASYGWLYGVTARTANDAWAVGVSYGETGVFSLIEHWNGKTWQRIPSLDPGAASNTLYSVTAIPNSNQLWAVGTSVGTNGQHQTLVERWNGTTWQVVPSPNIGTVGSDLASVTALSTSNAWAVGSGNSRTLIEHWNGKNWSVVSQPVLATQSSLAAITRVPASNNLWAVGGSGNNSQSTLSERYN